MVFEEHPVCSILGGLTAAATFVVLTTMVSNPFAYAGLLGAGMVGGGVFGLGLAGWLDARRNALDSAGTGRTTTADTAGQPALLLPLDGSEQPNRLFADRIRYEPLDRPGRLH